MSFLSFFRKHPEAMPGVGSYTSPKGHFNPNRNSNPNPNPNPNHNPNPDPNP